jgi:hypothetical protein
MTGIGVEGCGMIEFTANTIVTIYVAVIALDLIGATAAFTHRFPVARWRWWQLVYLDIVLGGSLFLICLGSCPLTTAESCLWRLGDSEKAYDGSFVSHYVPDLPRTVDLWMTCLLMLTGLVAVLRVADYQIHRLAFAALIAELQIQS